MFKYMHGPAFNKLFAYKEFHEAEDAGGRPSSASDAPEGKVFVAISRYENREEAVRVSDDDILALVPNEDTEWLLMPTDRAERLVTPI
jgi:hypothetical protein